MRRAIVVSSPNAYRMNTDLVAEALGAYLTEKDFDVLQLTREARPPATNPDDVIFFLQLGSPELFHGCRGTKVVLNFHPTAPDSRYGRHAQEFFRTIFDNVRAGHVDYVFEYNQHSADWMAEAGLPAIFCPIGYHPHFDNTLPYPTSDGQDGVYFIGRSKGRRKQILDACGASVFQETWGAQRRNYTRLEGIHLSLASYNRFKTCLTLRLIVLLASNRRAIIHEETDWCPLEHGRHCLICKAEEISAQIEYLRAFPQMQKQLAAQCYSFVRENHRFDDALDRAMSMARIF